MNDNLKDKLEGFSLLPEEEQAWYSWNDENVAFIKNDVYDGKNMWLIYAADGTKIAATDNRDFAFIVAKQNDLLPLSVH